MTSGRVYLVGAGPGDPGLLTVRASHLIRHGQVVIYDRLVGIEILNLIPQSAKVIDVGKLPDNHAVPQEEINRIILEEAMAGNDVVRLKGGDPYLFGRGREELELLVENHIDFEVVPGITSAIAVPSYAGIPVTHRDYCSSLHVFTGHAREGKELQIPYESIVKKQGTLVFLMGVSALPEICQGLLGAGMDGNMPAAIIQRGTTKDQRRLVATLGTLSQQAREEGIQNPAVIVIGEVCKDASQFDWYTKKPMFGKRIVVTRPRELVSTMGDKIRELGGEVLEFPCIQTVPLCESDEETKLFRGIQSYTWLVLTSAFGVDTLFEKLRAHKMDVRDLHGIRIAAIGKGTAQEFRNLGIEPDFIPDTYDVKHLAQGLVPRLTANDKVLMLRAQDGSKEINEIFEKQKISYMDFPIYETRTVATAEHRFSIEPIRKLAFDLAAFTSASTVRGFVEALPETDFSKITAVCIGNETAAEARKHHMNVVISREATIDSVVDALIDC